MKDQLLHTSCHLVVGVWIYSSKTSQTSFEKFKISDESYMPTRLGIQKLEHTEMVKISASLFLKRNRVREILAFGKELLCYIN